MSFVGQPYHKKQFISSIHKVTLENCIHVFKYLNQSLSKTFKNWFTFARASHKLNTSWSNLGCLKIHSHNTKLCGRHSVNISVISTWNYLQKLHVNILLYQLPLTSLKNLIKKYNTSNYN